MIVALLTILFSMYLLYVVPIQGRDAEISHMKYITQEFIGLKADIDGLIINNKINMPIARSFELGTLSSVGSGSLSILPLSSFIESTGLLMVNEQNDFISVTVNGDLVNLSNLPPIVTPPITNPVLEINCVDPNHCPSTPINYTISDRFYNITAKVRYSFNDTMVDPSTKNVFSKYFIFDNFTLPEEKYTNGSPVEISVIKGLILNSSYDLVMETWTNSTPKTFISEKTLIENLSFGDNYTYNILKDNVLFPKNSTDYYLINSGEAISADLYAPHVVKTQIGMFPPRIGSFQYESSNRYWVNQNLLYEMGGLFLNQPADGGSSVMLIPSIALTPLRNISQDASSEYNLKVSVNNIRITDTEDISGSVSAQIFSKVDQINQNLFNASTDTTSNFGTAPGNADLWKMRENEEPNARAIWLQFIPDDPRVINSTYRESRKLTAPEKERMKTTTELWKRGFDQIKTITNKTLSDNAELNPIIGGYSRWIYSFRVENSTDSTDPPFPPYSANMVIGKSAAQLDSFGCDPITYTADAATCRDAVQNYIKNTNDDKFILDYVDSEVSLVMQSGAL